MFRLLATTVIAFLGFWGCVRAHFDDTKRPAPVKTSQGGQGDCHKDSLCGSYPNPGGRTVIYRSTNPPCLNESLQWRPPNGVVFNCELVHYSNHASLMWVRAAELVDKTDYA